MALTLLARSKCYITKDVSVPPLVPPVVLLTGLTPTDWRCDAGGGKASAWHMVDGKNRWAKIRLSSIPFLKL
jgi:hypothetical protein